MKLVFSLFLSHIRIFKERSDKSQKSTLINECSFLSSDQVKRVVEPSGIEPLTSCVQGRRSPSWAMAPLSNLSFLLTATLHLSLVQSHTEVCSFTRSGVRLALSKKSVVILFKCHLKATLKRYLQTPDNCQLFKSKSLLTSFTDFFLGKAFKREV